MIRIEIKTANVTPRNIVAKQGPRAGQTIQLLEQEAYAETYGDNGKHAYPSRITLNLESNEKPYPPGVYTVDPASLYVDRFQKLQLGRLRLTPVAATRPAAAAA